MSNNLPMKEFKLFHVSLFLLILFSPSIKAQDGVLIDYQATPPVRDASAVLELRSTNQGLLVPRVDISDLATAAPVTSPATSLLVYNTNATTGKGYYYWDGSKWVAMYEPEGLNDVGTIQAFAGNTYPNDMYLPLSGGTYLKTDYPEFTAILGSLDADLVTTTSTTFTLANWNTGGIFLRGQGSPAAALGSLQTAGTKLPSTSFTTSAFNASSNGVNNVATSTNGDHSHGITTHQDDFNQCCGSNPGWVRDGPNSGVWKNTNNAGNHSHTLNIPSLTVPIPALTINGGGDAETRPVNRSVNWVIKVRPSAAYVGAMTVNNVTQVDADWYKGGTAVPSTDISDNIYTQGNVAIGTTTPSTNTRLSVNNNAGAAGARVQILGTDAVNSTWRLATPSSGVVAFGGNIDHNVDLGFFDNGNTTFTSRLRVEANTGDVGIATTNPSYKLDVNGTGRFTGDVHMPKNIAYYQAVGEWNYDNANVGFRAVGGATNSLAVTTGDIIHITANLKFKFVNGSGNDDVRFRIRVAGSCTANLDDTWEFENFDNDRNEYQGVDLQYIYVATCTGNITFQLFADPNSDADDSSRYGDLTIVATKY